MDFNTNLSACGRALICWLFLIPATLFGQSNWSDITFGETEGLPQKEIYQCIEDVQLLQPILENSVWHGVSTITRKGIISIRIEENENNIEIHLRDNGKGFPKDKWEAILIRKDTSGSRVL